MRTTLMMMAMLSAWALPAQAEHNEEWPAVQKQDASPLVMAVRPSEADHAGVRNHAPVRGTHDEGRPALRKLGPAPKVRLTGAQIAEAVEDRLPVLVAREVVVGDEVAHDALGDVGADQALDIVGGAEARLAPLHVDDGAEAALEGAAAPGVEAGDRAAVTAHHGRGQERGRLVV